MDHFCTCEVEAGFTSQDVSSPIGAHSYHSVSMAQQLGKWWLILRFPLQLSGRGRHCTVVPLTSTPRFHSAVLLAVSLPAVN